MTTSEQIADLLDQLQNQTGIRFAITDNQADEEETILILKNMLRAQHDGTSRESFLRGLLLGLLTPQEIAEGIRRFHIDNDALIFPILIETRQPFSALEQSVVLQLFSSGADTVIMIDDCHIALLRRIPQPLDERAMHQMIRDIQNTLETEAMVSMNLAYDGTVTSMDQLPGVFLTISTTLEICHVFTPTQHICWAHDLGLGKLIYQLPTDICEEYLKDHFHGLHMEDIDEETLHTIHVFLESGLSIAECARHLYLHRNTLIYRLDKIEQLTGLDIRKFDDAMTCKVALMISSYLQQK